jgi:hypothetical protein
MLDALLHHPPHLKQLLSDRQPKLMRFEIVSTTLGCASSPSGGVIPR